jgi:pimeloyl-ACP methyl ester carboxylesterase
VKALAVAALVGCATTPATGTATEAPTERTDHAHYAAIHGLRMYYEDHDGGHRHDRPLVLLHGGGSTVQSSFGAILPRLARTRRVIAPEQQAHGHTADIDRPLSLEQMADDTAALLEQLGVHDADVLGFSNGGVVALQLAIRHTALVHRLILCSSYYARSGFPPAFWQGFDRATPADMPAPLRNAYLAAAPHPEALPVSFAKQVAMMKAFTDIPEASLRAIDAPALVMVGDADVMPTEHAAQLARLLPHAQLAVLPGSSHGTYLGAVEGAKPGSLLPDIALAMIDAFLAERH